MCVCVCDPHFTHLPHQPWLHMPFDHFLFGGADLPPLVGGLQKEVWSRRAVCSREHSSGLNHSTALGAGVQPLGLHALLCGGVLRSSTWALLGYSLGIEAQSQNPVGYEQCRPQTCT